MNVNIDLADRRLFKQMLPSYLDGEATESEAAFVSRKIEQCKFCRGIYENEKSIYECIKRSLAQDRVSLPTPFFNKLQQSVFSQAPVAAI
jgi:predicted anti-sigma-YlaC factor YlaD